MNYTIEKREGAKVREEMTYNQKGNLVEMHTITDMSTKGTLDFIEHDVQTYQYDVNNNLIRHKYCVLKNNCTIRKYVYDEQQQLVQEASFNQYDEKVSQYSIQYDKNGLKKHIYYGFDIENPEVLTTYQYEYY